jgi:hypothetical protein
MKLRIPAPVCGREQARETQPLDLQGGGPAGIHAVVDRLLGGAQGQRRARPRSARSCRARPE